MTEKINRYKVLLIITDKNQENILVLKDSDKFILPDVVIESEWFWSPFFSNEIAEESIKKVGLNLHYLREVTSVGDTTLCEMEILYDSETISEGEWLPITKLEEISITNDKIETGISTWNNERLDIPPLRPDWENYSWYQQKLDLLKTIITSEGYELSGEIEKVKSYCGGIVSRINLKSDKRLYFKQSINRGIPEKVVLEILGSEFPEYFPKIVASGENNEWFLMEEFNDTCISELSKGKELFLEKALSNIAKIQIYSSKVSDKFREAGASFMTLDNLYNLYETIVGDTPLLTKGNSALDITDVNILRNNLPIIKEICEELKRFNIPYMVVNEDFREGNIGVDQESGKIVFYDWSDTLITHPFFVVNRYLDYVEVDDSIEFDNDFNDPSDSERKLIRDSYLDQFSEFESRENLLKAFNLSRDLNTVYLVVRWYRYMAMSPKSVEYDSIVRSYLGSVLKLIERINKRDPIEN